MEPKKNKKIRPTVVRTMPRHDVFDIIYIFLAGGLCGTLYETFLVLFRDGNFEDRSGSILTPFNYVYGIGAVVIFLALRQLENPFIVFIGGTFLGGAVEYALSAAQELILGSRSWDYSSHTLNIGGRTTVTCMLIWGGLCCLGIYVIFPSLLMLVHKMPEKLRRRVSSALLMLLCLDAVLSFLAVIRYSQRAAGNFRSNHFAGLIDNVFNDSFMQKHYPNMVFS